MELDRAAEAVVLGRLEGVADDGERFSVLSEEIGRRSFGADFPLVLVDPVLPRAKGFLTVWPARADGTCAAADRPLASNLNYGAGQVVANLAVAATNATGRMCVYTLARTHIVADLAALL
jgi:hypothetical protein